LNPTGFEPGVGLMLAGFVATCSAFEVLVQSAGMRRRETPMKQAFSLGDRSVFRTFGTIGTSYVAAYLPG
jgi:hypothetical protein